MNKGLIAALTVAALCLASIPAMSENSPAKVTSAQIDKAFSNPDARYRPFVRWWWNGDRVEADEIVRELRLMKEAGIGGVEINPISFPSGAEAAGRKSLEWLSDEWIAMLKTAFDEANRLGMTCDLIIGSGWPFGAETLPRDERASVMLTCAKELKGGQRFEISEFALCKEVDPGVTVVNPRRTCKVVECLLVPNPVNDISEAVDLTDKFVDGVLTIDVPDGPHYLYALIQYDSFACVINGAPGAAGSILNHLDAKAVRKYLDHMTDTIEPKIGPLSGYLRAFFMDSIELEGNNWTYDFAAEFRRRRGYDLMPWLPFTMFKVGRLGDVQDFNYGAKKGGKFADDVMRVRFDFELTKAELYQERLINTLQAWCREKGVKSRAQAYGRGFFPLESSLGFDYPEGESWTTNWLGHKLGEEMGDEDYRRGRGYTMIDKYVSSAAHLTGKRVVSAEEMTNTYKVFNTSLEFLKLGSDMAAFSGITHSIWHGFNYSPPDVPFPGWVQYGTYHNEKNTWWPYVRNLNDYRARLSAILQNVDMATDIAILPANYDMWGEIGVQTEPFPVKLNIPYTSLVWEAIHKNGGCADYVSDIILRDATVSGGKLRYGVKEYGDLILVEVGGITEEALDKISRFVRDGGRVFCIGKYPDRSLGLKDHEERDAAVKAEVDALVSGYPDRFILLDKAEKDAYLEWCGPVMDKYKLPRAVTISTPDRFLLHNHYVTDDKADLYLFANASLKERKATDLVFPDKVVRGRKAWLYDPATAKRYSITLSGNRFHLDLGPAETVVIAFNRLGGKAPAWKPLPMEGTDSITVKGPWNASLRNPQVDTLMTAALDTLVDLKDLPEYKNFMGTVVYTASFKAEAGRLPKYLSLGKTCEIASVRINGKDAGLRWFGTRPLPVEGLVVPGENTIEVTVTTLMGNYLQTLTENKAAQRYILRRKQPLVSTGLLGPVVLYR